MIAPQSSGCTHCHRPTSGCPIASNGGDYAQCELRTISASQISSAIVLLVALFFFAYASISKAEPQYHDFAFQATLFLLGTIAYYFLGSWQLEEEHVVTLRKLKSGHAQAEFIFRTIILGLLAITPVLLDKLEASGLIGIRAELTCLVIIFVCFLIWDAIVAFGDSGESEQFTLAWNFFKMDAGGAVIVLLALASILFDLQNLRAFAATLATGFILISGFRAWKPVILPLFQRLRDRKLQR